MANPGATDTTALDNPGATDTTSVDNPGATDTNIVAKPRSHRYDILRLTPKPQIRM
jgi:hypothetical protein